LGKPHITNAEAKADCFIKSLLDVMLYKYVYEG
jgi:hypothetical protein